MDDTEALQLFGTTQALVPSRRLVAGALSCTLQDGGLRDVRWHGVEVVRGITYLLRDRDWGTVPAVVSDLVIETSQKEFTVRFELVMVTPNGTLRGQATVIGCATGELRFEVEATGDTEIATNRCGFVVLHPASVAGRELDVEHTDGCTSRTRFPLEISPSQPVFDIRSLAYRASDEVLVQCRLEAELPGDPAGKFEMEDQRNWSDASFKTYVASLLDPWPYTLPAGRGLRQSVRLRASGSQRGPATLSDRDGLTLGRPLSRRLPSLGVGVPPGFHRAMRSEVEALRALGVQWWIVETELGNESAARDLKAVAAARAGLDIAVQLDVVVPDELSPESAAGVASAACREAGLLVQAIRLLPVSYLRSYQPSDVWPELPPLEDYARCARNAFPGTLVGTGMFTYFTELNRKRPDTSGVDFIGHCTCPIVHAADDESVMQTIEALPHIVHSVHATWPGTAYRLGPTSIAMRRNPYGSAPAANPRLERIAMANADPRHRARFGAAWLVAYVAAVAALGIEVLSLLEACGDSGPFPPSSGQTVGEDATCVPAWLALRHLACGAGHPLVPLEGLPRSLAGVAWQAHGGRTEGLVANLTGECVDLPSTQELRVAGGTPSRRLSLGPFEVVNFVVTAQIDSSI